MSQPRQIVFIMTDTQRRDMLGCYGNSEMHTPSLDRLASEGLRFDQAYTCQPVCGPARSAIFTGTWPHSNGSWSNSQPLGDNVKTIGQRLRDNGMETAYVGKWHLDGGDYFGLGRCPDGWNPDYWYDMRNYMEELSPTDRKRSREFDTCLEPGFSADFTYAHRCSNRAIDFLQTHREQDFLLVVSYDEPHHPWLCPAPYNTMYQDYQPPQRPNWQDDLTAKPVHQQVWAGENTGKGPQNLGAKFWQAFYGCNAFVDSEIGRVIEAVDDLAPDSLLIYTSDHGDGLGSHGITNKGPAMYDEITRIPLIVRWPGHTPSDTVCQHPVSHISLTPTIMEAAGLPQSKALEGKSMLATIQQPETRPDENIFIEYGRYEVDHDSFGGFQPIRAVCNGRYKLVINLLTSDELYDREADPDELENRIDDPEYYEIRDQLHDALLEWMNDTRDPFRGYYWERRPWRSNARPATWAYSSMTRQRENEEYEPRQLDYDDGLPIKSAVRRK